MRSRLQFSFRVFLILGSALALAQSSHAPIGGQVDGLSSISPETPKGLSSAQHVVKPVKATRPLTNTSQGSALVFAPALTYISGMDPAPAMVVADVNGDGIPDVIVGGGCLGAPCIRQHGTVGVLLGNGDGTFQPVMTYDSGGAGVQSVAVADVNGDGKPDIVVANFFSVANQSYGSASVGVCWGTEMAPFKLR